MKILIVLSPPVVRGPVPQCIAIQAHQPDAVHFIQTLYPGQQANKHQFEYTQAWLSKSLLSKYNLDDPYPVPVSAPIGYICSEKVVPTLHFHQVDMDGLVPKINELSELFSRDKVCFDLLPGGKEAKLQSFFAENKNLNLTYSTENGKIIDLSSGLTEEGSSIPLSLIDRFWLSGEPVYVEKSHAAIEDDSTFLTAIYDALSIEVLTERKKEELVARRTTSKRQGKIRVSDVFDRPLSTFNEGFRTNFECEGVMLQHPNAESDDLIFEFEDGRIESFPEKKEGHPNGTVLEPVITNLLNKHWSLHDSLTGVSVIYPRPEDRRESYRNLTQLAYDANHLHGKEDQFALRCEKVSLEWKTTSVEQLMEAEFEAIRDGVLSVDEALKFIRQVELDTICLVDSGVLSFDTKAFISDLGPSKMKQKAMQKPSSLFNNRSSGQYYVVCSTSPDQTLNHQPVIHMTKLVNGPPVINQHNKHQWMPTPKEIQSLQIKCTGELTSFLRRQKVLGLEEIMDAVSKGVGVKQEVLARLFCHDEGASELEILDVLVCSNVELKRQLDVHLERISSDLLLQIERLLRDEIWNKKIKLQAKERKRIQKRKIPYKKALQKKKKERNTLHKSILKLEGENDHHTMEYMHMKLELSSLDAEIDKIKSERKSLVAEKERELKELNHDSIVIELPPLPPNEMLGQAVENFLRNQNTKLPRALSILIDLHLDMHGFLLERE